MAFPGQLPSDLSRLLVRFKELRIAARQGQLAPERRPDYDAAREELARSLLASQRLNLRANETPRRALRVNRALFVDLYLAGAWSRGTTLDISTGGFALFLTNEMTPGKGVAFQLYPTETAVLRGFARVTRARREPTGEQHVRVSFAFEELPASDIEVLELVVFDTVLLLWGDVSPDSRRNDR